MYYYTYDISLAILDLDPNLCENFLFFVTLSILHIQTCMIHLKKAVLKGFISFLHLRASSNLWGCYDQKTKKKQTFFFVTESFLHIESCVMPLLKALVKGFISFCYT